MSKMLLVPMLFLLALAAAGYLMYRDTESKTGCTGVECENLTADELADKVIEARTR